MRIVARTLLVGVVWTGSAVACVWLRTANGASCLNAAILSCLAAPHPSLHSRRCRRRSWHSVPGRTLLPAWTMPAPARTGSCISVTSITLHLIVVTWPKRVNWLINYSINWIIKPSVLWRCWLGGKKGVRPVKTEWWGVGMVICLERRADLHMAQLMPLPLTVSCFSKIQIGFTFLVPAYPGITEKGAVKRVCVLLYRNTFCMAALNCGSKHEYNVNTNKKLKLKSTLLVLIKFWQTLDDTTVIKKVHICFRSAIYVKSRIALVKNIKDETNCVQCSVNKTNAMQNSWFWVS